MPRIHRHYAARIDAARKKGAERHIGDHPHADGFAQPRDQLLLGLFAADRAAVDKAYIPVAARLRRRLAASDEQRMRRRELLHAAIDRARIRYVAISKKL